MLKIYSVGHSLTNDRLAFHIFVIYWHILVYLFFNEDPRKKYHVKLLAYNFVGDGYQAHQTISTPGCVCKSHSKHLLK